jgi:hypothetical protein
VPFYRDDACFDDGTGDNPVARPYPGEATTDSRVKQGYVDAAGGTPYEQLTCDQKQGAWGEHGVHFFATGDTDNAFVGTPVPVDEVDAQQWQFAVPTATPHAVGEPYAQEVRVPLVVVAAPEPNKADTPHETSLSILGTPSGQATDDAVVSARLADDRRHEPVAGQKVTFTLDKQTAEGVTDGDGVVSATIKGLAVGAGAYRLHASFAGTDELVPSAAETDFEVRAEDVSLTARVAGPTIVTATLTDPETSKPLDGRTIRFLVDGTQVGTARTDAQGQATVVLTRRLKKESVVEAVFDGDTNPRTYAAARARAS